MFSIFFKWILVALFIVPNVDGKALYLSTTKCDRALAAGTVYMTRASVSSNARTVIVKRGSTVLSHGDYYNYGETLTVTLSATNGQYVFETENAPFTNGGCDGARRLANTVTGYITVPSSGTADVSIWAGWTTANTVPVSVGDKFVLKAPPSDSPTTFPTESPTMEPTVEPTLFPTVSQSPTEAPTAIPTDAPILPTNAPVGPSLFPTIHPTLHPTTTHLTHVATTVVPTHHPSHVPSHTPTLRPSVEGAINDNTASTNSADTLSDKTTPEKVIAGVIIGMASTIILLYASFYAANRILTQRENDSDKVVDTTPKNTFLKIAAAIAIAMTLLAIILVSHWASDGNKTEGDPTYVGKPSWEKNAKGWHVVLMVGGFYTSQIVAISSWTFIPNKVAAKICHITAQVVGLSMMFAGLWSILKFKFSDKTPNFSTMHSWIGIASISMYGLNFAWGMVMATLTHFFPDSVFRRAFDLGAMHKNIGTFALWMVNISIFTGIMSHLPYGACFEKSYETVGYTKADVDSAKHYDSVPDGCRIGHGIGITVLVGTMFIMLAVSFRQGATSKFNSAMIYPKEVLVEKPVVAANYEVACVSPSDSKRELPL